MGSNSSFGKQWPIRAISNSSDGYLTLLRCQCAGHVPWYILLSIYTTSLLLYTLIIQIIEKSQHFVSTQASQIFPYFDKSLHFCSVWAFQIFPVPISGKQPRNLFLCTWHQINTCSSRFQLIKSAVPGSMLAELIRFYKPNLWWMGKNSSFQKPWPSCAMSNNSR